jgi:hypothetical protein
MKLNRICIYPKDIQRITGRSERYGRKLLQECKKQLGKQEYQLVSIDEFANFIGLPSEKIQEYIKD